jgi:aminoglycoside 3-N-acetyltransferase
VAEDILDNSWPIKSWYRKKKFLIKDGGFSREFELRERKPKWGALHFAERTLCKDLLSSGLMKSTVIDDVIVEIVKASELIDFLNSKNENGYPYFWTRR